MNLPPEHRSRVPSGSGAGSGLRRLSPKRLFDLGLAWSALVVLAPLLVFLYVLVWSRLGDPVLFRQRRTGWHGEPFEIIKFRTMTNERDERGELLADAKRLTSLGQWLRSTSLDELPELWNVIRGEMSLIGPRPLLEEYLPLYNERQARRHEVRPGVTGWAQVNGRNATSWEERFEMDVWYVENRSFVLDLRILWRTFWIVIRQEGVSARGHVTMPRFKGSEESGRARREGVRSG